MDDLSYTWNVVLLGLWNRAILTPAGMAHRVFGLPPSQVGIIPVAQDTSEATPFEIQFAIDWILPPKVSYNNVVTSVFGDKIIFEPKTESFDALNVAFQFGKNVLENLPETPVSAIGVNLNAAITQEHEIYEVICGRCLFADVLDEAVNAFVDGQGRLAMRSVSRTFSLGEGTIKIVFEKKEDEDVVNLLFNFQRTSKLPAQLAEWINSPANDFREKANSILEHILR